jgi:hypothetical protein
MSIFAYSDTVNLSKEPKLFEKEEEMCHLATVLSSHTVLVDIVFSNSLMR